MGARRSRSRRCRRSWPRGAQGLGAFLVEVRSQLSGAKVAHFDETGGRIEGRLQWIHSASTETLTLLTAHRKRGVEAMHDAGVLPAFRGVAVHDGWAPYRNFSDALHALCGAHHLRELTAAHEQGQAWALGMSCLLLDTKDAVDQAKTGGRQRLSAKRLSELHASCRERIKHATRRIPVGRPAAEAYQGAKPAAAPGSARAGGGAVRARLPGAV
ncbi:MAG TPA: transposase [Chloroflexota bacterium]